MRVFIVACLALLVLNIPDSASAQGKPGPGAKIYDFPPPWGSFPRGTRGFYLKRLPSSICPSGIYWVRLGGYGGRANERGRTSTCTG